MSSRRPANKSARKSGEFPIAPPKFIDQNFARCLGLGDITPTNNGDRGCAGGKERANSWISSTSRVVSGRPAMRASKLDNLVQNADLSLVPSILANSH